MRFRHQHSLYNINDATLGLQVVSNNNLIDIDVHTEEYKSILQSFRNTIISLMNKVKYEQDTHQLIADFRRNADPDHILNIIKSRFGERRFFSMGANTIGSMITKHINLHPALIENIKALYNMKQKLWLQTKNNECNNKTLNFI